ncbi:MAG: hypothetical protein HFE97_00345 [Oscillospiraceae bacterium]|nr:hypothetical protein [Oscillospiraceae bacterium]
MREENIYIPPALLEQLERDGIPPKRVRDLIQTAEAHGIKFRIGADYCASQRMGTITLWVVYHILSSGEIHVDRAYHHRMQLIPEEESHA